MTPILAANLLAPNAGLIIWISITFGAFMFVLWRFAWGPITSALAAREDNIRVSMEQAQKALAESKQIQADNDRARRDSEADAQRLLREARETADRLRSEEVDKTRAQIKQMQVSAQAEIERERDSALDALRSEVADLAIQAAERVLGSEVDGARQRTLVKDYLKGLSKN